MEKMGIPTFVLEDGHRALGIRFVPKEDEAPIIYAKGEKAERDMIVNVAMNEDIPIVVDFGSVASIYQKVELFDYIPEDAYAPIVDIMKRLIENKEISFV